MSTDEICICCCFRRANRENAIYYTSVYIPICYVCWYRERWDVFRYNYFFEWMVWNFLILSSIPAFINLFQLNQVIYWGLISICLLFVSKIMYTTLVDYTGARPSEYYSVKKRPSYREYQKTTNMFFPGPRKIV